MTYEIYSDNFEKFETKMNHIIKKSEKYPECNIKYEVLGDVYKEVKDDDGHKHTCRFIKVDVDGTVINNGWRFLATLEHIKEGENVVRKADTTIEIPEYFNHVKCKCDHCNTNRQRKDTYIVYNEETKEFKQVGKTCLKEYTNGLSAEAVACFESFIHEADDEEYSYINWGDYTPYDKIKTVLRYTYPMIKRYGYVPTRDYDGYYNPNSTKNYVWLVYDYFVNHHSSTDCQKILDDGYNKDDVDYDFINNALDWIKNCNITNAYIRNLKAVCSVEYVNIHRDLGLLVSLLNTYKKELTKQKETKQNKKSRYVGDIGQKITFDVSSAMFVTSYDTQYGTMNIYRFVDNDNNVYIWKTSTYVNIDEAKSVTGTIKAHTEYRDTKQTELTRCKIKEVA